MPAMMFDLPKTAALAIPESTGRLGSGAIHMNYPFTQANFTVLKGLGQTFQFFIRDIDRQLAVITGTIYTAVITDPRTNTVLLSRNLVLQDATQALFALYLVPIDTLDWPIASLRYSITITRADASQNVLWADRNYTPYGEMNVIDGPIPGPALPVTLDPSTFVITDQWAASSPIPVSLYVSGVQTTSLYMTGYTGIVKVQGTLQPQPTANSVDWFDVVSQDFTLQSGVTAITTSGQYTYVRIMIAVNELPLIYSPFQIMPIPVVGTVDKILVKC